MAMYNLGASEGLDARFLHPSSSCGLPVPALTPAMRKRHASLWIIDEGRVSSPL